MEQKSATNILKSVFQVVLKKIRKYVCGYRKGSMMFLIVVVIIIPFWLFLVTFSLKMSSVVSEALRPPLSHLRKDLSHFRRNRSLKYYFERIQLLIEPSEYPCSNVAEVPLVALVTSSPARLEYREAIRQTWGQHFPTYFVLGVVDSKDDDFLKNNYIEAKLYGDMVVYDFKDHYQNLTIKSALMMKWVLERCPQANFVYKVDDDFLVNPWVLKQVLKEKGDRGKLIGYVNRNLEPHRDETSKWYLPRWLCHEDVIPEYLSGGGYIINGEYLEKVLGAAKHVPLHNLEDVYFTYHVAQKTLGYKLTHDERLSSKRLQPTWFPFSACAYWLMASMHDFTPREMIKYWKYIEEIGSKYNPGKEPCTLYNNYLKPYLVML